MFLSSLRLQNFRNFKNLSIQFFEEGALIFGKNGSGKTNLLESIYFLSSGRSQRGASKQALIHSHFQDSFIEGVLNREDTETTISIGFSRSKKIVIKKNNQKLRLFSEIFNNVNIVSFGPQDIQLVYGDPSIRRKFLDMIISQTDAKYLEKLILYKKYLINRNKLLIINSNDRSIEIYEEKMAEHGAYIYIRRMHFFDTISSVFTDYLNVVNLGHLSATIHYNPSFKNNEINSNNLSESFFKSMGKMRKKDTLTGYTSVGPHRDDFNIMLHNNPVKTYGSHGQCRAIAIALRLCAIYYFEKRGSNKIIILADDIFNELDEGKVSNIYPLLKKRGQLFLTSLSGKNTIFQELPGFSINNNTINVL